LTLSPDDWNRVLDAFHGALPLDSGARGAFLSEAFPDEPQLRREVDSLLAAHESEPDFLELSAAHPGIAAAEPGTAHGASSGGRVGEYTVLGPLGRGGMGTVVLASRAGAAHRAPVALKLMRSGLDSADAARRFRSEQTILGALQHPGIARLLDGGATEDGRPFLVMEYVEGALSIDRYCDERRLPIRERLALFRDVCEAVQYAHRNLVVHRDLKPSNILVSDQGHAKIVDFGISKLLDAGAGEDAQPLTRTGARLLTPEYASPEQLQGAPVTTATDVYALGLVLYKLVSGRRPFRFANTTTDEVIRVVTQSDAPPPSAAIARDAAQRGAPGDSAADAGAEEIAAARSSTPERLRRELRGDLDTIVLLAMHKDPERRYASVAAFSEDIGRFLAQRPVVARGDTIGYRARKFVARNRTAVGIAAVAVAALSALSLNAAVQARRIERLAGETAAERDKAKAVARFLTDVFKVADPATSRGEKVTAGELLESGARRIDGEMAGEPALKAELMGVIGQVYMSLAQYARADSLLSRSLAIRRAELGEAHPDVAAALVALGDLRYHQGRYDSADSLVRDGAGRQERAFGAGDPTTATSMGLLASIENETGRYVEAEATMRAALAALTERLGPGAEEVARAQNGLAETLQHQDRYAEAESLLREALATRRRLHGERHPAVAASLQNLGALVRRTGRLAEADSIFREALALDRALHGDDHPLVAAALNNRAGLLREMGEYDAAAAHYEEGIGIARRMLGAEHPTTVTLLGNLAAAQIDRGDFAAAESVLVELVSIVEGLFGPVHEQTSAVVNNLSFVLESRGDLAGAEREARRALAIDRALYGGEHTEVARTLSNLSTLLHTAGKRGESLALAEEALAMRRRLLPATHREVAASMHNVAALILEREPVRAESLLLEAVAVRREALPANDWRTALSESLLVEARAARTAKEREQR